MKCRDIQGAERTRDGGEVPCGGRGARGGRETALGVHWVWRVGAAALQSPVYVTETPPNRAGEGS